MERYLSLRKTNTMWELVRVVRRHLLPETVDTQGTKSEDGFGDLLEAGIS